MKSIATRVDLPSRSAILNKFAALVSGELSPDDVSQWAETWLLADNPIGSDVQVCDPFVREAIKLLAGADVQGEPGSFLYGKEDFQLWLENLKGAPLPT